MSPGFTDTATTAPGIGDLKMLEVSSSAFSGMYLLSSAASLVSICNLYWGVKEKKMEKKVTKIKTIRKVFKYKDIS